MFISLIPELFIFSSISILLIWGVWIVNQYDLQIPHLFSWLVCYSLSLSIFLLITSLDIYNISFNGSIINDNFSVFLKILVCGITALCLITSLTYLEVAAIRSYEYFILFLFSVLGMMLLISSYDLITLYLSLEMQSLSLYILASFKKNSAFSTEAGLKYFLLGAISSGLLLLGSSLLYGFSGTINFENFSRLFLGAAQIENNFLGIQVAIVLITASFFFKLAVVPFHSWIPDIYEGAPTSVSFFFATVPKIAIMGILIRFCFVALLEITSIVQPLFSICALLSLLFAALGALMQRKIKRFFAFSAIGHTGYMVRFDGAFVDGKKE